MDKALTESGTVSRATYARLGDARLGLDHAKTRDEFVRVQVHARFTLTPGATLWIAPSTEGGIAAPPTDDYALVAKPSDDAGERTQETTLLFQRHPDVPRVHGGVVDAREDAALFGHLRAGVHAMRLWYRVDFGVAQVLRATAHLVDAK